VLLGYLISDSLYVSERRDGLVYLAVMLDALLSFAFYPFGLLQFIFLALIGEPFPQQYLALQAIGTVVALRRGLDFALGKPMQGAFNATTLLAAIYIGTQSLSFIASSDISGSIRGLITSFQLFIMLLLIIDFIGTNARVILVMSVAILAGLVNAALAIYQSAQTARSAGITGNANELGLFQVTLLALLLPMLHRVRPLSRLLLTTASVGVIVYSIALTLSRGSMVAAGAVLLYYFFLSRQSKMATAVAIVVILTVSALLLPARVYERIEEIPFVSTQAASAVDGSTRIRLMYIDIGIRMGLDHPWTGVGLKQFDANITRYASVRDIPALSAHNTYVSVFAETGFPGLLSFLTLLGVTLLSARRNSSRLATNSTVGSSIAAGAELALAAIMVAGFFGSFEYFKIPWIVLALANVSLNTFEPE